MGNGAVEVKTTLSSFGFRAKINSLEQLDDALVQPLFLAGIRLALNINGITLPELINDLRNILSKTPESIAMFNSALLSIGFIEDKTNYYKRRFLLEEKRIMRVSGDFPRIIDSKISNEIRKVKYVLDLDMIVGFEIDFIEVLKQLKAI
ncbi:MAG: PD-(D/E)XK motif protein [Candidatus Roizmanbacteria bacterium]|nr:PD-(D/E)XK motif protein [Candidatus Roizmanbacteria bacterium]